MLIKTLDIRGYGGQSVPNTFIDQSEGGRGQSGRQLAILFPGLNYNVFKPALYYASLLMASRGADILQLEYNYNVQEFLDLTTAGQQDWIASDASAAFQSAINQQSYAQLTLIGKSLGSLALGHLLVSIPMLREACFIWLTPLLRNPDLRKQISSTRHRALFVIGSADQQYDAELLNELEMATGGQSLVLPGANHGLEISGKPAQSIRLQQQIIEKLNAFIP